MVFAGSKEGINMFFYIETEKIKNELSENRRFFHKTAEVGLEMPLAQEYVIKKLTEYGLSPKKCGHGVTALIGSGSPAMVALGIVLGLLGFAGMGANYPIYKKLLAKGKQKYAFEIMELAKKISEE